MTRKTSNRYFDLSALFALGLAALLLVSIPGGCSDSDESEDEEDIQSEAVAEPTAPPIMDIVDPEPGDLQSAPDQPDDEELPTGDGDGDGDGNEDETEEPAAEENDGTPANDGVYVVQDGDTLYAIAVQFGVSMDALMAENGMNDPNALQVGQELQIPQQ
jgi:LysM repeat protein